MSDKPEDVRERFRKTVNPAEAELGARMTYEVVCQAIKDPTVKENYENIGLLIEKSPRAALYALAQINAMAAAIYTGTSLGEISEAITKLHAEFDDKKEQELRQAQDQGDKPVI